MIWYNNIMHLIYKGIVWLSTVINRCTWKWWGWPLMSAEWFSSCMVCVGLCWFGAGHSIQEWNPRWQWEMGIEAWIVCYRGATMSNMVSGDKAQCSDQVCVVTLEEVLWSVTMLPQKTLIIAGLCMSYIKTINDTIIGRCAFNYHYPDTQIFYITIPNDTIEVNSFMCSGLNWTGQLYSYYQQGLGPALCSYQMQCVKCLDKWYGWLLYLTTSLEHRPSIPDFV